jgi:Holliday junction resolvase RusA-like endonuclease
VIPGELVRLRVAGVPATQGSKTGFIVPGKNGGKARGAVRDLNPKRLKPWREAVRSDMQSWLAEHDDWQPLTGPLWVHLWFALPKPASAPKRTRTWPIGARSGDIDKLTRSVLDSLTDAGVWLDDSQVVHLDVGKDYPGPDVGQTVPGVLIVVGKTLGVIADALNSSTSEEPLPERMF